MSIAVAVQKQGRIALATDSQTNLGGERVPPENRTDPKYLRIGDAYLAATGWTLYTNILEDVLKRRRAQPRLDSEMRIFVFFNELWRVLHERYNFVRDQGGEDGDRSPFGSLDSSFLVACPTGLYSVSSDLSVTRYERYFAIGSGAPVALGAVHAIYEGDLSASAIAERAVGAAMSHDIYCGPPVNLVEIRERRARRPRRTGG
jgi:ATP-dependent HslUV protease, peptidase subunit HslV